MHKDTQAVTAAHRGAVAELQGRRAAAEQQSRADGEARLRDLLRAAAEEMASALHTVAQANRRLLEVEHLCRPRGLRPLPDPLAWAELLSTVGKVARNRRIVFDYGPAWDRALMVLWFERARAAGYEIPDLEPVALADLLPAGG